MRNVVYVDAIEGYTNPETGKGWTPREEAVIAKIMAEESFTEPLFLSIRLQAIHRMRRRRLDDLKGMIRVVQATTNLPESDMRRCSCGALLIGKRTGAKWCSDACRMRLGRQNNPKTHIQNKRLTDAKLGRPVVGAIKQDVRVSHAIRKAA